MTLYYTFDNGNIEYDISYREIKEFIDQLDKDVLVEFCKEMWNKEDHTNIDEDDLIQKESDWDTVVEKYKGIVEDVVFDNLDDFEDWFKEDMKDYFANAAYELYGDAEDYRRDSYEYYGLMPSDFH